MRGWRGGAAALLVAAVLLPAPLLLKRRAAAPADEWRRAEVDRALAARGRRAAGRRDDEDVDRALAPPAALADGDALPAQIECSRDVRVEGTSRRAVGPSVVDDLDSWPPADQSLFAPGRHRVLGLCSSRSEGRHKHPATVVTVKTKRRRGT